MVYRIILIYFLQFYFQISYSRITPCISNSPCLRACPCTGETKSKYKISNQPTLCTNTVYCIAERCICPQSQVIEDSCRDPSTKETSECAIQQINMPGMPSIPINPTTVVSSTTGTGGINPLQICEVKRKYYCRKRRVRRNYCVFSYMPNLQSVAGGGTGGGTIPVSSIIPGFPIPIPNFQIPQLPIPNNPIGEGVTESDERGKMEDGENRNKTVEEEGVGGISSTGRKDEM